MPFTLYDLQKKCETLSDNLKNFKQKLTPDQSKASDEKIKMIEDGVVEIRKALSKPSRLGLVGQVAAGKTRLLETLLGSVGGILSQNVGAGATTGNIVEYFVSEASETQNETTFDNWRVRFMDKIRIDEIFALYFNAFVEASLRSTTLKEELDKLRKIRAQRAGYSHFGYWNEILKWAVDVYNNQTLEDSTRLLALETYRIAGVVSQAQSWFGKEVVVSEEQALQLMTFPNVQKTTTNLKYDGFVVIPSFPDSAKNPTENNLNAEALKAFFNIVHKISVDVKVPRKVFETYSKYGNSYCFVDCPGYGAARSPIRDRILCFAELQDVDAVLVLLDSRNPGHRCDFFDQAEQRWGLVEAHKRAIVVLNKFDSLQIKPGSEVSEAFKALLSSETPVSDDKVLDSLESPLKQPYTYALKHVKSGDPKRIVFFSSVAYVGSRKHKDGVSLGVAKEMERYSEPNWSGKQECDDWNVVASKMDKQTEFRSLLQDFALDGGGSRLINAFGSLLNQYGQTSQLERLTRDLERLDSIFKSLQPQDTFSTPPVGGSQSDLCPKEQEIALNNLDQLLKFVGSKDIETFDNLLFNEIKLAKEKARDYLVDEIAKWSAWKALMNTCDKSFLVGSNAVRISLPKDTNYFVSDFLGTISIIYKAVLDSLESKVAKAFEKFEKDFADWDNVQIENLKRTFEAHKGIVENSDLHTEKSQEWFDKPLIGSMTMLLDFNEIRSRVERAINIPNKTVPNEEFEESKFSEYYPLQHGSQPLVFAWNNDVICKAKESKVSCEDLRHFACVMQIRQAFFNAISQFVKNAFDTAYYVILQYLYELFCEYGINFAKLLDDLKGSVVVFPPKGPTGSTLKF